MMLEVDMRTFLLAQASLQAIVADRVFGLTRPQNAAIPAIMLQRATSQRQVLFCGTDKLVDAQMQVDAYAISGEDAWGLARALRQLLVDFSGMMAATFVDQCTLANEFPLVDPDPGIIRVTQLYNIWYVED